MRTRMLFWFLAITMAGFDVASGADPLITLEGHQNVVSVIRFAAEGNRLISGSWDKTVRFWNLSVEEKSTASEVQEDWVLDLRISGDQREILAASQRRLNRLSMVQWDVIDRGVELGGASVNSVALSRSAELLAVGGRDGFATLWKIGESAPRLRLSGFESWVSQVVITPDDKTLVTGTRTGWIRLFDTAKGRPLNAWQAHPDRQVMELSVHPEGGILLSSGYEQTAVIRRLDDGEVLAKLTGHRGIVTASAWSKSGSILATGERHGSIHLWKTSDWSLIRKFAAHPDKQLGFSVTSLEFSPDEKQIASGSVDRTIKLWRVDP